jgi:hypothetical protein
MHQTQITRRKASSRRASTEVEQVFPVPAVETTGADDSAAVLARIDAALADS